MLLRGLNVLLMIAITYVAIRNARDEHISAFGAFGMWASGFCTCNIFIMVLDMVAKM